MNMLAIANGRPETMGLKQIIKSNVDFQFEVATRKYTNLLAKEMERKEIQEGLIKACNVIDLVIEILRGSKDRAMAKACLVEGKVDGIKFKSKESKIMAAQLMFTEKQANAILEMRLYKLIGLELEALINEHEETLANIYRYEDILDRRDSMAQVIMNELDGFKKEYSHPRKTVIENGQEAVYKEKELEEMDVVFLMDRFGYAKPSTCLLMNGIKKPRMQRINTSLPVKTPDVSVCLPIPVRCIPSRYWICLTANSVTRVCLSIM